jgi:hypothetical protein
VRRLHPAAHRVALIPQFPGQFLLHHAGCIERHRVQVLVHLRQKPDPVFPDVVGRLVAALVVLEPFGRRDAGHADVEAPLLRITFGIGCLDFLLLQHGRVEQDDVNMMVVVCYC